jgi:formylglycine-generating enzyme required for sulfatase activity
MPIEVANAIGMKLVVIPPGEFLMGSDEATTPAEERPQHHVRITKLFLLGVYEVTQEEFRKVTGGNPSKFTDDPRLPVEQVTWDQCQDFLRRLNNLTDEKEAGRSYRLPTEAEWEYACRAGTQTRTCYGDSLAVDQANFNGEHAAEPGINRRRTLPVGSFKPNAWGLYDMLGNVSEGVADWFSETYYSESPLEDPQGPADGTAGVARGGGWADWGCRSAMRDSGPRSGVYPNVGFRVLCELASTKLPIKATEPSQRRSPVTQPTNRKGRKSGF